VASLLKGPLGWAFCMLVPYLAWFFATGLRFPDIRDWLAFAVGYVAAAAIWVVPVLILDRGVYLASFLTQPDLTTWHLTDTLRRIHWPWMYGVVGLLPLALLLPLAVADARKRGVSASLAIALGMLVVLSLIPKKRMHYQLPVYPFLALVVAEAVIHFAARRWVERAAWALVALSFAAGFLYWGVVVPRLRPGEDPKFAAARKILAQTSAMEPIIGVGQIAETIAFVGRRADILERTTAEQIVDALRASPTSALIVVARSDQGVLDSVRTHFRLDEVDRVEGDRRTWLVYRAPGAGPPVVGGP
jgi:hypothetical protein